MPRSRLGTHRREPTFTSAESRPQDLPLCIDLEQALVTVDTRSESLLRALRRPASTWRLAYWLFRGTTYLKRRLAEYDGVNPAALPYNLELLAYLRNERGRGRRIVLIAADKVMARTIADHLGLFDEVVTVDSARTVDGARKAVALVERFGHRGFAYAGGPRQGLEVWRYAGAAVLIEASSSVATSVGRLTTIETRIGERRSWWHAVFKAVRPYQWSKNLLVFVPIVTANATLDAVAWGKAALMFIAFSATASSIYLVNDLTDLEADRQHPQKRLRPFARGSLPVSSAPALVLSLLIIGLAVAVAIHQWRIVLLYAVCSVVYSAVLKELPLVDIFLLAALYSIRLFGGGEASGHPVSTWLLAFSSFLFLSLAIVKRTGELKDLSARGDGKMLRRGYSPADLQILTFFGVSASFCSTIVLALYVQSRETTAVHSRPELLWAIVPLLLFWQCRLWLSTTRGYMTDDPIVYSARDWVSWIVAGCVAIVFVMAAVG